MDKQQAIQFIQNSIDQDRDQAEIIQTLSSELKAPPEMVARFVQQVSASYQPAPPPVSPPPPRNDGAIPSWIIDMEQAVAAGAAAALPEADAGTPPESVRPARPADSLPPDGMAVDRPQEEREVDLQNLAAGVLERLKKQRRHNDVVEYVCNETGWHWNKAQRFVARVQTENHDNLNQRQNQLVIFVGIVIILVGIITLSWGGSMAWSFLGPIVSGTGISLRIEVLIYGISLIGTGLAMMIGGGYGIGRAVSNR